MTLTFEFRKMTDEEYKREQEAFDEHAAESGNPPENQKRLGFVATVDGKFIGASSGVVLENNNKYGRYFKLTDLLVEKAYRKKGHGKKLLDLLEEKIKDLGIEYIYTWTAEYEAESFYLKEGYEEFARFEDYYYSGHSRVGLIKSL